MLLGRGKGQTVLFLGDFSYADVHPFHDNEKWDTFGRFVEKSSAYEPWIYCPGNHELDLALFSSHTSTDTTCLSELLIAHHHFGSRLSVHPHTSSCFLLTPPSAISAVMGTRRLPFPSNVFDLIHCARCRVPYDLNYCYFCKGGKLLLELNRLLRPGGYFVWSATPVYRKHGEDAKIWKEMSALTEAMCWELVTITKDKLNEVDAAIYQKPESNECYNGRKKQEPPMCKPDDDPNALQACIHNNPIGDIERGSRWPEKWPARVQTPPYWLTKSQIGIYGKPAPDDFKADYEHWKNVVSKLYMNDLGLNWTNVRNVMDMRAVYGGFAAALKELKLWVLNVVSTSSPDTLPIIYERGLIGIYHDWCESFSTYPRTYDLLHADRLFSMLAKRCNITPVVVEIDRIVRPGGKLIVRDDSKIILKVEELLKSLHWDVHLIFPKNQEGILSAQKSTWRPDKYATAL